MFVHTSTMNGRAYTPETWTGSHEVDSDSENKNYPLSGKVILQFENKIQDMVIDRTKLIKLDKRFWFQEIEEQVRSVENKDWFCVIGPDHNEIGMLTRELSALDTLDQTKPKVKDDKPNDKEETICLLSEQREV